MTIAKGLLTHDFLSSTGLFGYHGIVHK